MGLRGCVAAGHPRVAEAGAEVLRSGGNAVDAALAACCTAFIAEPVLTSPGGGGFLLLRLPEGRCMLYDGFARMPRLPASAVPDIDFKPVPIDFGNAVQTFHIGQGSVATPSLLGMLFAAHRHHGRMPIREVLVPAIQHAREGIPLTPLQAAFLQLLTPILTAEEPCRNLHTIDGRPLAAGDRFCNKDLADILELLAIEGIEEMYRGEVARAMVAACQPRGLLRLEDLSAPQYEIRTPLQVRCLGGELITNPPPSAGGTLIAFTLKLLERMIRRRLDTALLLLLAEALRCTSEARSRSFDAHIHDEGIAERLLSEDHLEHWLTVAARRLNGGSAAKEPENIHGSTTHISIVDRWGTAVSLTSSNGEGSGIVVPKTGIHLNNMLGEEDVNPLGFHRHPAGLPLPSMMAPSLFLSKGGPMIILGSGGSNRLRSAIVQVLCRILLQGDDIERAVQAPRIHNEGTTLDAEPDAISVKERRTLIRLGWDVNVWDRCSVYFGGVHAIAINGDRMHAAGDPRRGGAVAWA